MTSQVQREQEISNPKSENRYKESRQQNFDGALIPKACKPREDATLNVPDPLPVDLAAGKLPSRSNEPISWYEQAWQQGKSIYGEAASGISSAYNSSRQWLGEKKDYAMARISVACGNLEGSAARLFGENNFVARILSECSRYFAIASNGKADMLLAELGKGSSFSVVVPKSFESAAAASVNFVPEEYRSFEQFKTDFARKVDRDQVARQHKLNRNEKADEAALDDIIEDMAEKEYSKAREISELKDAKIAELRQTYRC